MLKRNDNARIVGSFVDVAIGVFFVRYMHIRQREVGSSKFTYCGWSLQFPLGIAIPLPGMVGAFAAKQKTWSRSRAATLSVINTTTNVDTISINTTATLQATLKNTSGHDTTLSTGATMNINMPSFFSDDDVAAMSIDLTGWTFAVDGGKLTLTLSEGYTWGEGDELSFEITNVKSSSQPSSGNSDIGSVRLTMDTQTESTLPIVAAAEFDLVWANYEATLNWTVTLNSSDGLTLTGDSSGSVTGYASPGNDVVQLTTATDQSNNTWVPGYIFNYGTDNSGNSAPQVRAAWSKQGAAQAGNNVYYGFYVIENDGTSTAYYKNQSSASSLAVAVEFAS
jgi:hypothetical protein